MVKKTPKIDSNTSGGDKSLQEQIDELKGLMKENLRYTKSMDQFSQGNGGLKDQGQLHKLLQENLKISKELHEMTKNIKRWVTIQRVWGALKILIIFIPLTLGMIYLPPLVKKGIEPLQEIYQNFLGLNQGVKDQSSIIQQITDQLNNNGSITE